MMQPLDVYGVPLEGMRLIEASAGTGKTWTITGLYLRLLLAGECSVEQILVVTFTKAATAELRERIRARINEVRRALLQGTSDDAFCQWVLQQWRGEARGSAIERLEIARRTFDQAAILTIHGFCQRVLADFQIPALLDEPDVVTDEASLLPGLVKEAWIRHCGGPLTAAVLLHGKLHGTRLTPDTLMQDLHAVLRKPYLQVQGRIGRVSEADLQPRWRGLQAQWVSEHQAIMDDANAANGLSRAKDAYKNLAGMLAELDEAMQSDCVQLSADLQKLRTSEFENNRLKKGTLPQHEFWNEMDRFWQEAEVLADGFRRAVIADVVQNLQTTKREQQQIAYQDLLAILNEQVQDAAFAAAIRRAFPAALIDEFQDTDPLQFGIFKNIYAGSEAPAFLVGDPKQAIYSFRGADIFTYFRAAELAQDVYTLDTNRRSVPTLVKAVNALFANHSNSFLLPRLEFQPVQALDDKLALVGDDKHSALEFWLLPDADGKPLTKEVAGDLAANSTAAEIARLLNAGAKGSLHIGAAPVVARDIAVLVSTHRQGRQVHEALAERGVASVLRSQDSVFASAEALAMLRLLEAVAQPGRDGIVKAALLSDFVGYTLDEVMALADSDSEWGALVEQLMMLRERWYRQGFMVMWEGLLDYFAIFPRLLALTDSERRLTNIRHLAALVQQAADAEPTPDRQLVWLRDQTVDDEGNEEAQLRLESDAERVQILTIHVSKGLEYPIVFCPFLWDGALLRRNEKDRAEYHGENGAVLDLGSPAFGLAMVEMARERLAEKLRLLYVALTRAQYRCYAAWGPVKEVETAALSWLLLGQEAEADPAALRAALKGLNAEACREALGQLVQRSEGAAGFREINEIDSGIRYRRANYSAPQLTLPSAHRELRRRWSVSSFTGLTASAHELELPDHDAGVARPLAPEPEQPPEGIHAFPRGAQAGVFWHELLEFFVVEEDEARAPFIEDRLHKYAIDPQWLPLVESHLGLLLDTPLDEAGLTLSRLEGAVVEMEFTYPVGGLTVEKLKQFASRADIPEAYRAAVGLLDFSTLNGFLKGFIDLICRHQGRYYVLDYKTNWLGTTAASYTAAAMQQSVAESHYYLQYWLYTLALHRYLGQVLPDYDYDTYIGGVRYVYLRGVDGSGQYGVYSNRPPRAVIEALDRLLRGAR